MYNVMNKKCTLNYFSMHSRVEFTVQCAVKKSVKYNAYYF